MVDNKNPMFNSSGCKDPTAYFAINQVSKEEAELNQRVHLLITTLKNTINLAGFEVISRIEVRDIKTRKEFR